MVTLWRQEDTKWDWIPTDDPTVIYIYALRHDHLEMVISRYDKVADEDDVVNPLTRSLAQVLLEHHVMSKMEIRHINGCS